MTRPPCSSGACDWEPYTDRPDLEHCVTAGCGVDPRPAVGTTIQPGTPVEVRDFDGQWHPRTARSDVRVDQIRTLDRRRQAFPSVAVGWHGDDDPQTVNWPAEDVRVAASRT